MKLTHLYVADHQMMWNGIRLEAGDLYGHHDFYGLVYSHVPAGPNVVYFRKVEDADFHIAFFHRELPMVTPWEATDGNVYFDGEVEFPEEFAPVVVSDIDWDASIVQSLLDECDEDEEVAMYSDGENAYFFIHPMYSSPDRNGYGECIETWYAI